MRYLSKGELLTMLGTESDKFTAFMLDPASFGVTGTGLTNLKVAKQKLDWADTIDIDMPEVQNMLTMLQSLSVISPATLAKINSIEPRKASDLFIVNTIALDAVTVTNKYGAKLLQNGMYSVDATLTNNRPKAKYYETFMFTSSPTTTDINGAINNKIADIKRRL